MVIVGMGNDETIYLETIKRITNCLWYDRQGEQDNNGEVEEKEEKEGNKGMPIAFSPVRCKNTLE